MKNRENWYKLYDETYSKIKKWIEDHPDDFEVKKDQEIDFDTFELFCWELEDSGIINFGIYSRSDTNQDNYWTECDYYSDKVKRTIIYESDYRDQADNLDDFIDQMATTQANILEFESKI